MRHIATNFFFTLVDQLQPISNIQYGNVVWMFSYLPACEGISFHVSFCQLKIGPIKKMKDSQMQDFLNHPINQS